MEVNPEAVIKVIRGLRGLRREAEWRASKWQRLALAKAAECRRLRRAERWWAAAVVAIVAWEVWQWL